MASAILVEFILLWASFQSVTTSDQSGLFVLSALIFPLVCTALFLIWPASLEIKPKPQVLLPVQPAEIKTQALPSAMASKKAIGRSGAEGSLEVKHSWEYRGATKTDAIPLIKAEVDGPPATIDGIVPKTPSFAAAATRKVSTIVPIGMVKAQEVGSKEKFASIVPHSIGIEKPIPAGGRPIPQMFARKSSEPLSEIPRDFEFRPEDKVDYEALKSKIKGMKFALVGWWPLGWSRVITDPELPAQFWKLQEGKIVQGVLMGYDTNSKQYVAWMAKVQDGLFTEVHEMARSDNEQGLIDHVKELLKEVDFREAESAHELLEEK